MKSLFDPPDRQSIRDRFDTLQPASARQWGKMDPAQMLTHCSLTLEMATGDPPMKQKLIGKILSPLVRSLVTTDKPFSKNGPTDPKFVVSDARDFAKEKERLTKILDRFCDLGPAAAGRQTHAFFGKLTGDEWGWLMYKHLDHHLRQFGM
jgi:hypothetical protein